MNSPRKKICIVIPELYVGGGAERVAVRLGEQLENKYEVCYFTMHDNDNEISTNNKYCLHQPNYFKFLLIPYNSYKLYNFCKKNNIDFVISHMERSNCISILSKILFPNNVKVFCVNHNYKYITSILGKLLSKFLYPFADKIVCVSKQSMNVLINYKLKNVTTIYNPFPSNDIFEKGNEKNLNIQFSNKIKNNENIIFINIGRLTKQKGQEHLIKIFSKVVKKHKSAILFIFGEGELRSKLQRMISERNLESNIFLMGNTNNVFKYLKRSEYFLFTSLWEGLPTVLIESLHFTNLKIFSTDCKSGPREILAPHKKINSKLYYPYKTKNGYLFEAFNLEDKKILDKQISIYANKIIASIDQPFNIDDKEMKKYIYENFNEKVIGEKWMTLLNES